MKQRVSDYIADFLVTNGIEDIFTITGGGAMHLNDAFGHHPKLHCTYNHHEQACAMAAEAYARIDNKIAAVCVTSGPGGTNAMTGVLGGWLDSIPMFIISGQVKYETTVRSTGLNLRQFGDQEFDITKCVQSMTKYAEMLINPDDIRYHLEKALYLATHGRPGPVWLDIPLNVQGAVIEIENLRSFDNKQEQLEIIPDISESQIQEVLAKIRMAKRPVLNAGNGIRISGGYAQFLQLVEKLKIPVVTAWNSIDLLPDEHPLYVGRAGIMGDRAGNFAIQNSDLVLSIGCRLSIRQVGYNYKTWAREAYTIVVDIDEVELKKPTLRIDMKICADANGFLKKLLEGIDSEPIKEGVFWNEKCTQWKSKYPVVSEKHYEEGTINVYAFIRQLSLNFPQNYITVVANGSACVVGSQAEVIKKGQRFIINSGTASMGYDLPAAIGACIGAGRKEVSCISGDGSIQMNLQELQTIKTNQLPIKIYVINNGGYHSIRQTQKNFFGEPLVGIGVDSKDLEFPSLEKISKAYGFSYFRCSDSIELNETIVQTRLHKDALICEIVVNHEQVFEPKSATKRLGNGILVSAPLEDMAPFLPRQEFLENMIITPLDNE